MAAPDYDFKSLSPYDFETLARDVLGAHDGLAYSTYRVGADGGVDLRAGAAGDVTVAQCKHTPDADRRTLVRMARAEREKVSRMSPAPQQYVFLTSADLTAAAEKELLDVLEGTAETVRVHGRGWFNTCLAHHPHLERRHFKLWLTSTQAIREMLQGGVFLRGISRVKRIERNYQRFVFHDACAMAEEALAASGCVLLEGSPGAGKTAIAEYLVLQWWHRGYRIVVDPRTVDRWWEWIDDDVPTVFFFDDIWGQNSYGDHGSRHHDTDVRELIESLLARHDEAPFAKLLIMTSRTQVLRDTVRLSDASRHALGFLADSKVTVGQLPIGVRARILFNHVHAAVTAPSTRAKLADGDWWHDVARHQNYAPRIIELVVARNRRSGATELVADLRQALDNPQEIWGASFSSLPPYDQQLLLTLAVMDSRGVPWQDLVARMESLSSVESSFDIATERLRDSWIADEPTRRGHRLSLADPSQRDYLTRYLATHPAAMASLISRAVHFDDLALLCQQGMATELDTHEKLFSLDGEDLLRPVLDECAAPLLERLRQLWDALADRQRAAEAVDPDELTKLVDSLERTVIFHADRYRTVPQGLPSPWFRQALNTLTVTMQRCQFARITELAAVVNKLRFGSHTGQRRFDGYAAHALGTLEQFHLNVWEHHLPKPSAQPETNGLADDEIDEILEIASELAEVDLYLTSGLLDSRNTDARAVAYLNEQDPFDPSDLDRWLEDVETVADVTLPRARARLSALVSRAQIAGTPSPPPIAPTPSRQHPLPRRHGTRTPESPDSVAALFRSLADPGSA